MAHCPDQEVFAEALLEFQGIALSVEGYSIEHPWGCFTTGALVPVSLLFRPHVR